MMRIAFLLSLLIACRSAAEIHHYAIGLDIEPPPWAIDGKARYTIVGVVDTLSDGTPVVDTIAIGVVPGPAGDIAFASCPNPTRPVFERGFPIYIFPTDSAQVVSSVPDYPETPPEEPVHPPSSPGSRCGRGVHLGAVPVGIWILAEHRRRRHERRC